MSKGKTESIRFRCSKELYDFIERLRSVGRGEVNKRDRSDVVRNIITVFRMGWMTGNLDIDTMADQLGDKLEKAESLQDSDDEPDEKDEEA